MSDQPKKNESRFRRQQRVLAQLIDRLKRYPAERREEKEAQYRNIIRRSLAAAKESGVPSDALAAVCEKWLEQTGLTKRHRCAITAILHDTAIANAFLDAKKPLSLAMALEQIRQNTQSRSQEDAQPGPVELPPPNLNTILTTLCSQLLHSLLAKDFSLKCGIYELAFTKRTGGGIFITPPRAFEAELSRPAPRPEQGVVRLQLPPDIAASLGKAGRFSGLTREEVVAELVGRQDPAGLVEALNRREFLS